MQGTRHIASWIILYRKSTTSWRNNCTHGHKSIYVHMVSCKKTLIIAYIKSNHNHEGSPVSNPYQWPLSLLSTWTFVYRYVEWLHLSAFIHLITRQYIHLFRSPAGMEVQTNNFIWETCHILHSLMRCRSFWRGDWGHLVPFSSAWLREFTEII